MKKFVPVTLICVIFFTLCLNIKPTHCFNDESLTFHHNGKIFSYNLSTNIKTSNLFNEYYEINRFNRFSSKIERQKLLNHMLNLGFEKSVALEYLFPNLNQKINSMEKNIKITPKDASVNINSNSNKVFHINKEVVGKILNKEKLYTEICFAYLNNKSLNFELPTEEVLPSVFSKNIEKYTHLRADFSTDISSSTLDRKHNVKNALQSLNKVTIMPNEVFSFNKTVGRRTQENGYRNAKIIVNNEFVDGVGGGVCQVSTTLYNSALLAGLEIVEANKHSKMVGYVRRGFDAMVNFGSSDLKFKNNTGEKLTIITNYSSTKARIRIFGESLFATTYKLTNDVFNIVQPNEQVLEDEKGEYLSTVTYNDEYFYLKKGAVGMEIKTFRHKYKNHQLVSSELLRHDKYKVQDAIKIYGTKKREDKSSLFYSSIFDILLYGFSLIGYIQSLQYAKALTAL